MSLLWSKSGNIFKIYIYFMLRYFQLFVSYVLIAGRVKWKPETSSSHQTVFLSFIVCFFIPHVNAVKQIKILMFTWTQCPGRKCPVGQMSKGEKCPGGKMSRRTNVQCIFSSCTSALCSCQPLIVSIGVNKQECSRYWRDAIILIYLLLF